MKTHATAKMQTYDQMGIPSYDLSVEFQIEKLWMDISIVPFAEKKKKLNNIEEYVALVLQERMDDGVTITTYDWAWKRVEYDSINAMTFILDVFYSALDRCSEEWRKPFHVDIVEAKDKIEAYEEKHWVSISSLSELKEPEKKDDPVIKYLSVIESMLIDINKKMQPKIITQNTFTDSVPQKIPWYWVWAQTLQLDDTFTDQTEREQVDFDQPTPTRKRTRLTAFWIINE